MTPRTRLFIKKLRQLFSSKEDYFAVSEILKRTENLTSVEDRFEWLETLLYWIKKSDAGIGRYVRLTFFFKVLEGHPKLKEGFLNQISLLASEKSFQRFLLQTGFSDQHSLIAEIKSRLGNKLLPTVSECDFYELAFNIFTEEEDLVWVSKIPEDLLLKIKNLVAEAKEVQSAFSSGVKEALIILAAQVSSLGLTSQVRERSEVVRASKSPFFQLPTSVSEWISNKQSDSESREKLQQNIVSCRRQLQFVQEDMELNGTSISLVYKIELMSESLQRIEALAGVHYSSTPALVRNLITQCIECTAETSSVLDPISRSTHLLSRKIAERNGESGGHYIARSRKELRELFQSSLKGGAIVLIMTALKLEVLVETLPPALMFFVVWGIYSGGFLVMQFTHATLATKLPSFTASKLARLLNSVNNVSDLDSVAVEFRAVLKSQAVSFLGNILAVVPLTMLFHYLYSLGSSTFFVTEAMAISKLNSLDPVLSFAVPMGILTGVLLWISSLGGGWLENWLVFRKVPIAVSEMRNLKKVFGETKAQKLGKWVEMNASGIGSNLTLGFLFALVPFIGGLVGLPLDSQHVTISSATAVLSLSSINLGTGSALLLVSVISGLILIGAANLIVSFGLALFVAARASAIRTRRFKVLLTLLFRKLVGR